MTDDQRRFRMNVRNFLLIATPAELERELELSLELGDEFRAACVRELIEERRKENGGAVSDPSGR